MLCALIMAGGKGTRFWPLSTEKKPKQFLNLLGEETMIQMTVNRLLPLISMDKIFVVTGRQYYDLVKEQLPELPEENIILEPYGRNTAPCIALSAFYINKKYKDSTLVVLPSDHMIKDENIFLRAIKSAEEFVDNKEESIVTIGIKPDRPDTGYGYINFGQSVSNNDEYEIREVNKFVEKPNKEKAKEYLENGNYLWNAGMFIWKTKNIISLTNKYLSKTYDVLSELSAASEDDFEDILNIKYENVDNISIDYGILEKYDEIYVIPSDFGWDDVGSWSAIERLNKYKRIVLSDKSICEYESHNNIVFTNKKVVLNNVNDLIIVETNNYILISSKNDEQKIKNAVESYLKFEGENDESINSRSDCKS